MLTITTEQEFLHAIEEVLDSSAVLPSFVQVVLDAEQEDQRQPEDAIHSRRQQSSRKRFFPQFIEDAAKCNDRSSTIASSEHVFEQSVDHSYFPFGSLGGTVNLRSALYGAPHQLILA